VSLCDGDCEKTADLSLLIAARQPGEKKHVPTFNDSSLHINWFASVMQVDKRLIIFRSAPFKHNWQNFVQAEVIEDLAAIV
jgi:hypothetical protein